MSVIKSKRGSSNMQFLECALNLEVFTIKACMNFSKRYTFLITNDMVSLATEIHHSVKRANSIYPKSQYEAVLRRECFLRAYGDCQCLISQIQVAYELNIINSVKYDNAENSYKDLPEEQKQLKINSKKYKLDQQRDKLIEEWMLMIQQEMRLIKSMLKSDTKRFKDLREY